MLLGAHEKQRGVAESGDPWQDLEAEMGPVSDDWLWRGDSHVRFLDAKRALLGWPRMLPRERSQLRLWYHRMELAGGTVLDGAMRPSWHAVGHFLGAISTPHVQRHLVAASWEEQ